MKKILSLVVGATLSIVAMAQDNGMGNHNGNSSGTSFSGTEMLLGGILLVLIIGIAAWVFNSRRNRN